MVRPRISVAGLMLLILALGVGFVALRLASAAWAGVILFLTLGTLLTAVVGAIYRRQARRAFWLGFALFGWAYMIVTARIWIENDGPELISTMLLRSPDGYREDARVHGTLQSVLTQLRTGYDVGDQRIIAKLNMAVPIAFPNETPLEDVLKSIKASTQGPDDNGIPIYVDPIGLQDAEKTMQSPVTLDLEGLPLKTTLPLLLKQLGMSYMVRDGLMTITSQSRAYHDGEAFERIGHCYVALLVGGLGGLIARGFWTTRDSRPAAAGGAEGHEG
jgi:hypothetical protein